MKHACRTTRTLLRVQSLFCDTDMNNFLNIFSSFLLSLQTFINYLLVKEVFMQKQKLSPHDDHKNFSDENDLHHQHEIKLSKRDIKIVMGRLGFLDYEFEDECYEGFGEKELTELFEENEPGLEEVKQAFDVFDVNKDGFIDESELQRVLCRLGLISSEEGSRVDRCRRMIRAFDANGDGRIDFNEFVTCMDNCFC